MDGYEAAERGIPITRSRSIVSAPSAETDTRTAQTSQNFIEVHSEQAYLLC